MVDLCGYIVDVPDFPEPGIVFKDITLLLASREALLQSVNEMANPYLDSDVDIVVGLADARPTIAAANGGFDPGHSNLASEPALGVGRTVDFEIPRSSAISVCPSARRLVGSWGRVPVHCVPPFQRRS